MSCEYDGCPIEKFCEDVSIGIEDCCGTLRAYRKGKADERKKFAEWVLQAVKFWSEDCLMWMDAEVLVHEYEKQTEEKDHRKEQKQE